MAWSPIGTTSIAQGKFVSAELMTKIKGNLDYLYGINGGGQGPEILNGSFEVDSDADGVPDHWDCTAYAGGAVAIESTSPSEGAKSLKFTHPGGAGNGGGRADSEYFPVTTAEGYYVQFLTWVSAGASAMKNKVQARYYTAAQVELSSASPADLYSSTVNPTDPTRYAYDLTPIADCKFVKIRVVGGATDIDQAGVAYFDDVRVGIKIPEYAVQSAAITQAKLKTSQGSVSVTSTVGSNVTLPGGEYGFYPQLKGGVYPMDAKIGIALLSTAYVTNIWLRDASGVVPGGTAVNARQRYVTSSGEVFWVFYLRDKATKQVKATYAAPDHPCFGNGGNPEKMQHPFPDYDPAKHEIVVCNPTLSQLQAMEGARYNDGSAHPSRSIADVIMRDYELDDATDAKWPTIPVTVGLPAGHDWTRMQDGTEVTPIKMAIPQPEGMLCKLLKKKVDK